MPDFASDTVSRRFASEDELLATAGNQATEELRLAIARMRAEERCALATAVAALEE